MATKPGVDPERSARSVKAAATRAANKAVAQQAAAVALANEQAGTGADAPADVPAAPGSEVAPVLDTAPEDDAAPVLDGPPVVEAVPVEAPLEDTVVVEVAVIDAPATVDQVLLPPVVQPIEPVEVPVVEVPAAVEVPVVAERPARVRASRAGRTTKAAAPAVAAQPDPAAAVEPDLLAAAPAARPARRSARVVTPKLDAMGAAAVEEARAAAVEVAGPDGVGEHLGAAAEADRVTVHRFATTHPGYRGWTWTVVLARVPRARAVTVSEVVLLPGDGALLAPSWVPWTDRVEPGDLGQTDMLPYRDDDALLDEGLEAVPDGFDQAFSGDEAALVWELGLGRRRVLNREGRIDAATRWYRGDNGPDNAETRAADAPCSTCGYLVGLTGTFRQSFGVCANAWSPADGRVVSMDHGCGAHSETGQVTEEADELPEPLIDDLRAELDTEPVEPDPAAQSVTAGAEAPPEA